MGFYLPIYHSALIARIDFLSISLFHLPGTALDCDRLLVCTAVVQSSKLGSLALIWKGNALTLAVVPKGTFIHK